MGARLGHRKWFSKSEDIPIILLVFIRVWGNAIILVLGAILYFIVIEPIIKKRKLTREEDRQKQLSQNQ
jgi:flagellar biosynthesis/type III secretory pathway M-ring protein FliF/YscJ